MGESGDSNERGRAAVAEGKDLEQQVSTRRQGEPDRNDHPDDVTHRA